MWQERKYCSIACKSAALTRSLADRFWEKVDKTPGCWMWMAARKQGGYGRIGRGGRRGKGELAHRIAYELTFGKIPDGLSVCHRCDNPPCVNPDHLFLGSHEENMHDAAKKLRFPQRKLSYEDFCQIKDLLAHRVRQRDIAAQFMVSQHTIHDINKRGRSAYAERA